MTQISANAATRGAEEPERPLDAIALLRRFWPWMRPHARYIGIVLALQVIATPIAVIVPIVVRTVVDSSLNDPSVEQLLQWAGLLVALALLSAVAGFLAGWALLNFRIKVLRDLRLKLFRHMQRIPRSYHASHETGHMMSRQTDDVGNLKNVMADALTSIVIQALRGVAYVGMLFYVEWHMALGGLLLVAVMYVISHMTSARLRELAKDVLERWTDVSAAIHQGLSGHLLTQATAGEARESVRFTKILHAHVRSDVRQGMYVLYLSQAYGILSGTGPALIVLGGVFLIMTTDFTVGGLFAFFMYLGQLLSVVSLLVSFNARFQSSLASLSRIFEVLDTEPERSIDPDGGRRIEVHGMIRLDNVSFAYEDDRPVLIDLDIEIQPHSRVALVGPSGSGKSTLASLIPRFHDPTAGRVLIDGIDLRELELRSYRSQIGFVPQDVFLFDRSVAENISLGRKHITFDQIREAAEAANAMEFIEEMPAGLETAIGERGERLSGGQRQRIAIARELLRNPRILILDEATSALDSESENLVQEALERLLQGRTSIAIAHRLSTIIASDLILVMENGRFVERGTHQELIDLGGRYEGLYHSQFERHLRTATSH